MIKLFSWLFPQIHKFDSAINGPVKVVAGRGHPAISAGGYPQSGPRYQTTWKQAIKRTKSGGVKQILLLGLAGGTAISYLKQTYPKARITAVEIDPLMIKIFKDLTHPMPSKLSLIKADAIKWVKTSQPSRYQLVIVDLYLGSRNPPGSRQTPFLKAIKALSTKPSTIIYNTHFYPKETADFRLFLDRCRRLYSKVEILHQNARGRIIGLNP